MTNAIDSASPTRSVRRLPEGTWSIDPQRSELTFAVKNLWGLQTVRGVFGACRGTLAVRAHGVVGELAIEANSLDTGNKKRDQHLRSPDFFDVDRHPQIAFTTTAVAEDGDRPTVSGELVIRTSHVPLAIPVTVEQTADDALRLKGKLTVSRQAAGLTWNRMGMVGDEATLHARLTLDRVQPDGR